MPHRKLYLAAWRKIFPFSKYALVIVDVVLPTVFRPYFHQHDIEHNVPVCVRTDFDVGSGHQSLSRHFVSRAFVTTPRSSYVYALLKVRTAYQLLKVNFGDFENRGVFDIPVTNLNGFVSLSSSSDMLPRLEGNSSYSFQLKLTGSTR